MSNVTAGESIVSNATNTSSISLLAGGVRACIYTLISILVLLIIFGNSLVVLAFIVDKRLRTQRNFLLLNLAISDFFIGAISIPLFSPYKLTQQWKLGKVLCKLWLVSDYTMTTASVYNIVLISCDRYLSVTKAMLYRSSENNKTHTVLKIAAVWIFSFFLYTPAIFIFNKNDAEDICLPGFLQKPMFLLSASCFDFIFPLISIVFFNLSLYWNILRRSRMKAQSSTLRPLKEQESDNKPYIIFTENASPPGTADTNMGLKDSLKRWFNRTAAPVSSNNDTAANIHLIQLSRDKKAAKSLAVLVLVFAFCWAPYSVLAACRECCIHPYFNDITTWLLWINSAINPALYPLCHKSFKKAFSLIANKCVSICRSTKM